MLFVSNKLSTLHALLFGNCRSRIYLKAAYLISGDYDILSTGKTFTVHPNSLRKFASLRTDIILPNLEREGKNQLP
jgi:hypothetical protein